MVSADLHIGAEPLRELYERTGLSIAQFSRLIGASERTLHNAMAGSGLQGERYVQQYELIQQTTAELELEAVQELTPTVAFNSPRLRELMLRKFLSLRGGDIALQGGEDVKATKFHPR